MATPDNVQSLVESAGFGAEVDFLSIDIDLHTSHVFRALAIHPRAACIEYNAHLPPMIDYEVPYVEGEMWDGSNYFGASLKSLEMIASLKKLSLVGCDLHGVNAYFVQDAITGELFAKPFTAEHHYQPPRYQFVRGPRGHRRQEPTG
jgi:hypothetical protein